MAQILCQDLIKYYVTSYNDIDRILIERNSSECVLSQQIKNKIFNIVTTIWLLRIIFLVHKYKILQLVQA